MEKSLKDRLKRIRLLISDVDGVLTDGAIYKNDQGDEYKKFTVVDGTGMAIARAADLKIALISGRYSKATAIRAKELQIDDLFNGTLNKLEPLIKLKNKYNLENEEIAYIGDDLIDLLIMQEVGVPIAVNNAFDLVKNEALYITKKNGGMGAFREAIEWIVVGQGRFNATLQIMRNKIYVNK